MELQDVYIKRIEEMELKINMMETSFKKELLDKDIEYKRKIQEVQDGLKFKKVKDVKFVIKYT